MMLDFTNWSDIKMDVLKVLDAWIIPKNVFELLHSNFISGHSTNIAPRMNNNILGTCFILGVFLI